MLGMCLDKIKTFPETIRNLYPPTPIPMEIQRGVAKKNEIVKVSATLRELILART